MKLSGTQFICGEFYKGESSKTIKNYNPATNSLINEVPITSHKELERTLNAAYQAQKSWANTPQNIRADILQKAAKLLREKNRELAVIETQDTGRPFRETSTVDILSGSDALDFNAGCARTLSDDHINLVNKFFYTRRVPLGICAGIGAWNYPLQIACWKSAPALASGNVVIFKPSEKTPNSALHLAQIFHDAGLPPGVFNVVQGTSEVGEYLAKSKLVKKISLTGSLPTGRKILHESSKFLRPTSLELGGKSPLIIFDDALIEDAVNAALVGNFYSQGEICSNGTRVFVHKNIHKKFIDCLLSKMDNIKIGDPMDQNTHLGPLIDRAHLENVQNYVSIGKKEGAKMIFGEKSLLHLKNSPFENGNFISPIIFDQCEDDMTITKEEIFGPLMSILTFSSEEEVIIRANNTPYGLAAGVMTNNLKRGHLVAQALEAGVCWINNYNVTPVEMPFGGIKYSGLGSENGNESIKNYTQLKSVYVELDKVTDPFIN